MSRTLVLKIWGWTSRSLLHFHASCWRCLTTNELSVFAVLRRNGWIQSCAESLGSLRWFRCGPFFGPADFIKDPLLCFVLMPFNEQLDRVYASIVRPTVEAQGLVYRRADEIRGNQAIMQDIWRSLCEDRLVIAELTGRNSNVFYELGIAHTGQGNHHARTTGRGPISIRSRTHSANQLRRYSRRRSWPPYRT
jgi:hypothetical protein